MQFTFSTSHLPNGESNARRFQGFCDVFHEVFGELELESNDQPFDATLTAMRLGDVAIASSSGTISSSMFGGKLAQSDRLGLMINTGLEATRCLQRGRDEWVAPGGGMLLSREYAGQMTWEGDAAAVTIVECSRQALVAISPRAEDRLGRAIGADNEALGLLRGYLRVVGANGGLQSPALVAHSGRGIVDMIALVLGEARGLADIACDNGVKSSRMERIAEEIAARFAEPDFTVAALARRFDVSERTIQETLHRTGAGFTERLLDARLGYAHSMLTSAREARRKVSDIALSSGFNDLSYFHRSFRKRFGLTPADARAA